MGCRAQEALSHCLACRKLSIERTGACTEAAPEEPVRGRIWEKEAAQAGLLDALHISLRLRWGRADELMS